MNSLWHVSGKHLVMSDRQGSELQKFTNRAHVQTARVFTDQRNPLLPTETLLSSSLGQKAYIPTFRDYRS